MPHLALGGLCTVFDLGHKLRLYPNALVGDALTVGLGFPNKRRQPLTQVGGGFLVKPMIHLSSVNQVVAFAAPDVDAVPMPAGLADAMADDQCVSRRALRS